MEKNSAVDYPSNSLSSHDPPKEIFRHSNAEATRYFFENCATRFHFAGLFPTAWKTHFALHVAAAWNERISREVTRLHKQKQATWRLSHGLQADWLRHGHQRNRRCALFARTKYVIREDLNFSPKPCSQRRDAFHDCLGLAQSREDFQIFCCSYS
jgi:hypothetical protein